MDKPKDTVLHIGNNIDTATRQELTEFIESVFTAGANTNQSGKTIRHALSLFSECQEVKNITISNCNFTTK